MGEWETNSLQFSADNGFFGGFTRKHNLGFISEALLLVGDDWQIGVQLATIEVILR